MFTYNYNYKRAMMRYNEYNTDLSEKDKKLCAAVEAVTLEATRLAERTVTLTLATPCIIAEIAKCATKIAVGEIKDQVIESYDEYVKENGTQI